MSSHEPEPSHCRLCPQCQLSLSQPEALGDEGIVDLPPHTHPCQLHSKEVAPRTSTETCSHTCPFWAAELTPPCQMGLEKRTEAWQWGRAGMVWSGAAYGSSISVTMILWSQLGLLPHHLAPLPELGSVRPRTELG